MGFRVALLHKVRIDRNEGVFVGYLELGGSHQ